LPYNYKKDKEPVDLLFMVGNIIHKVYPSSVRFSHFGVNENYDELLKLKDYALLKSDVCKSFDVLDNINNTQDNSRYEYSLKYLCGIVHNIISKKKLNRIELLVRYKITDINDYMKIHLCQLI